MTIYIYIYVNLILLSLVIVYILFQFQTTASLPARDSGKLPSALRRRPNRRKNEKISSSYKFDVT